jgi:hypothetical protein
VNKSKKVSLEKCMEAVQLMKELIRFFPETEAACQAIARELYKFVGTEAQLNWFVERAIAKFSKWEGLPILRALYNTRFAPDDGIMPEVEVSGFTSDNLERQWKDRCAEDDMRSIDEYRRKALAAPQTYKAFELPAASNKMPELDDLPPLKKPDIIQ